MSNLVVSPKDCIVYKTKYLRLRGITVGLIEARYGYFEGGIKGYVTLRNLHQTEAPLSILAEVAIPNGTSKEVKKFIDTFIDNVTVQDL